MSVVDTLKEWINPDWGHHRTVPPMDAGLRRNTRLDDGVDLLDADSGRFRPDDAVAVGDARVIFSSGSRIHELNGGHARPLAEFESPVTALADAGDALVAAVAGRGIVALPKSGSSFDTPRDLCVDDVVGTAVTAITASNDGGLLVTVGSQRFDSGEWSSALLTGDRSGLLVRVDPAGKASVVARDLAWPAGVAVLGDGSLALASSLDHRVERRPAGSFARPGAALAENLPLFPGRLAVDGEQLWVAAPYVRNRMTELLLDEPAFIAEMMTELAPADWFVPRLRAENPLTDTMQMGQLRVDGEVKSWAPARSCGIAFRIDSSGRISESVHARVDSARHGVTAVVPRPGDLVVAVNGYGGLLAVDKTSVSEMAGSTAR